MVFAFLLTVAHEKHVRYQRIQAIAQVQLTFVRHICESLLYLALRIVGWFQLPDVIMIVVKILLFHLSGTLVEYAVYHPVGNERVAELVFVERKSVAFNLLARHAEGGAELSQQAVYGVGRNLPDTEEAQNMVYTVSVKILSHVLKAPDPPLTAVFQHRVPVVSGESPVLSVDRKIVWRRTGLPVEVEVVRLRPHVTTIPVYTDWDVTFHHDVAATGIIVHFKQLRMEHKLHVIPERGLAILA